MQGDQQVQQIKLRLKGMEVALEVMAKFSEKDKFYQGYKEAVKQMKEFIEQLEASGG
jgi:hypothetical protein